MKKHPAILILMILSMVFSIGLSACDTEEPVQTDGVTYTITLDQTALSMTVYEKQTLTAVVRNSNGQVVDQTVTWSSSNSSVASVTDGVVLAAGAGTANITAALADGTTVSCTVTSAYTGVIPQLVLDNVTGGSLTIANGQSFTLNAKISFNGKDCTDSDTTFHYTVEDPSVATVSDDGVITAVAEGRTKITILAGWRGLGGENLNGGEDAYGLKIVVELSVAAL